MFALIYGLVLFASQGWMVLSSPVKYDQRQHGDVNVQIDLKDLQIVALLKSDIFDDYTLDEYVNYDYADFTVKPLMKPTTKSPETTTSIQPSKSTTSTTTTKSETTENENSATSATTIHYNQTFENSTISSGSTTEEEISITSEVDDENKFGEITNVTEEISNPTTESLLEEPGSQKQRQTKRCRKGYVKSGRCHRRRISFLPLAMGIAPELVRSMRTRISI